MYEPGVMGQGQPAFAAELAEVARQKPLAIYAGAGLSQASPTDIPDGAEVAQRCYARLTNTFGPGVFNCEDSSNLTSVADAAAEIGGLELIRRTAVSVADFTSALPNFSHEILALLLLEGVGVVITTQLGRLHRAGWRRRTYHDNYIRSGSPTDPECSLTESARMRHQTNNGTDHYRRSRGATGVGTGRGKRTPFRLTHCVCRYR